MRRTTKLPIGIENFEEIHREDFYYVDKTGMIRELLEEWGKVNFFTRPRRFGKSLNMSMLKYFFEYGCDPAVFEGLETARDTSRLDSFCAALAAGDAAAVEEGFNAYLARTISIRDAGAHRGRKENFYHGVLLGLLSHREDWAVFSNAESGDGFSDILVESGGGELGIVIEVKYPDGGDLDKGCREALEQIERMGYEEKLRQEDVEKVLKYGIACNRKKCRVVKGQETDM